MSYFEDGDVEALADDVLDLIVEWTRTTMPAPPGEDVPAEDDRRAS